MQNTTSLIKRVAVVSGLMLGAFTLSALATNWTPPVSTPPTCTSGNPGCDAPINVSDSGQGKKGKFGIGPTVPDTGPAGTEVLHAYGAAAIDTLLATKFLSVTDGAAAGKFLKSVDASGAAVWDNLNAANSFIFKRSPIYTTTGGTTDAFTSCPTTHPTLVSCNVVDDEAPNSMLTVGCPDDSICPAVGARTQLGGDVVYTEWVQKNGVQGCLTYDHLHEHQEYRVDLVCSN